MQVFPQRISVPCLAVLLGLLGASCDWFGPPDFTDGATDTEVDESEPDGIEDGLEDDAAPDPDAPEDHAADDPADVDMGDEGSGTPPTVPTDLAAEVFSPTKVDLSWSPSMDDVGVAGYTVYRDGASVGTSATTDFRDVNLTPGMSFTYTVDAYDAEGAHSAHSEAAHVTTPAVNVRYEILKTSVPPVIDGSIAEFSGANTITISPSAGGNTAVVRILWDAEALYVAYDVSDTQLNGDETVRDRGAWSDDAIEFFVDMENDGRGRPVEYGMYPDDFQVIVNILGTYVDDQGTETGGNDSSWNLEEPFAISTFGGTINVNTDTDTGFVAEGRVPWEALGYPGGPANDTVIGMMVTQEDLDDAAAFNFEEWPPITATGYPDASVWSDFRLSSAFAD
jgi:hypothetical protein